MCCTSARQRRFHEGIESLQEKQCGIRVVNNFHHLETWRPIVNNFFDCEKNQNRQCIVTSVGVPVNWLRLHFPAHFNINFMSFNDHDMSLCRY